MRKLKNVGIAALVLALSFSLVWQIFLDNPSPGEAKVPVARTATYVVAASDALAHVKEQADYVCDGNADDVEINAAIAATGCSSITSATSSPLPATVKLFGNFSTTAPITVPSYLTLDLTDARITLADNSDCNVITVSSGFYASGGISYRAHIKGGVVDQNGANQASGYCILFQGYRGSIKDTMILSGKDGGLWLSPGTSPNCFENVFEGLQVFDWIGATSGVNFWHGSTDNFLHNCLIAKNNVDTGSGYCVSVFASGNIISENHFYYSYCHLRIQNKKATTVIGNYFDGVNNTGGASIQLEQTGSYTCEHIVIDGNIFSAPAPYDIDSHISLKCATAGNMNNIVISDNSFQSPYPDHCVASVGTAAPDSIIITNNAMGGGYDETSIDGTFTNSIIKDNTG